MRCDLTGKSVVLGVTGGIAAYKACEVVSRLRKMGADVYVIMTKSATEFVQPLTFETLSNHPVVTDAFARPATWEVSTSPWPNGRTCSPSLRPPPTSWRK